MGCVALKFRKFRYRPVPRLHITAYCAQAAAADLLAINQRLIGDLPLYLGIDLHASRQIMGMRQIAAEIDEVTAGFEPAVIKLIIFAPYSTSETESDPDIQIGFRALLEPR
jgi:hypothetical protein